MIPRVKVAKLKMLLLCFCSGSRQDVDLLPAGH